VGILKFLYGVEKFPSKTVALGNLSINKDRDFQALYELFWQRANSLLHMVAQFDLNDKKKGKNNLKGIRTTTALLYYKKKKKSEK
jgi:disease resistance protein RPS2